MLLSSIKRDALLAPLDPRRRLGQGKPPPDPNGLCMPKSPPPPRADKGPGTPKAPPPARTAKAAVKAPVGFLATFAHRPRLLAGAALMVAAHIPLQLGVEIREATRLLIAWNVCAAAVLLCIFLLLML